MRDFSSEKRECEMSTVEFCQSALRDRIAPPRHGSVKERIRIASRRLGWPFSRARDVWYADGRVSIRADELKQVEQATGLTYAAKTERRIHDDYIARAEALLRQDEDFHRPFVDALVALMRAMDRSGDIR